MLSLGIGAFVVGSAPSSAENFTLYQGDKVVTLPRDEVRAGLADGSLGPSTLVHEAGAWILLSTHPKWNELQAESRRVGASAPAPAPSAPAAGGTVYRNESYGFSVAPPDGFSKKEERDAAEYIVTWRDRRPPAKTVFQVNVIEISDPRERDVSSFSAWIRDAYVAKMRGTGSIQVESEASATVAGLAGTSIRMRAQGRGERIVMDFRTTVFGARGYSILYMTQEAWYEDEQADAEAAFASFRILDENEER